MKDLIKQWKTILEETEEDSSKKTTTKTTSDPKLDSELNSLIAIAQKVGGTPAKLANMAKKITENCQMNESEKTNGIGKRILYTVLGLSLALNALGAMNFKGAKDAKEREFASIMQNNKVIEEARGVCEQVHDMLDSIQDSMSAIDKTFLEPSDEEILNDMLKVTEQELKFENIMKS